MKIVGGGRRREELLEVAVADDREGAVISRDLAQIKTYQLGQISLDDGFADRWGKRRKFMDGQLLQLRAASQERSDAGIGRLGDVGEVGLGDQCGEELPIGLQEVFAPQRDLLIEQYFSCRFRDVHPK